jgi:hypothetical protein
MKISLSRKVLAKEGVDEKGEPLENMELYADIIEYDIPDGLPQEQIQEAIVVGVSKLIEQLFEVVVDIVEEDESTLIIPDKKLSLPPGFKVLNAPIIHESPEDNSVN